jgi:hypothetical protein
VSPILSAGGHGVQLRLDPQDALTARRRDIVFPVLQALEDPPASGLDVRAELANILGAGLILVRVHHRRRRPNQKTSTHKSQQNATPDPFHVGPLPVCTASDD